MNMQSRGDKLMQCGISCNRLRDAKFESLAVNDGRCRIVHIYWRAPLKSRRPKAT
jgi:hypothetical protein